MKMKYKEAVEYIFNQLPMYQRLGSAAYKNNLETTIALDNYFLKPHRKFKTVHIAGTNGKGSVSHILASVLQEAGYKTGLYTSPHLKDYRERIKINGNLIAEKFVCDFIESNMVYFKTLKPSFFEMSVALAFDYFYRENVDIAVIETGMGGRLDSTNIIKPVVSVITNIGFDHVHFLGDTLEKIAIEKAGIIKKNVPVVIGENNAKTHHVFIKKAEKMDSQLYTASNKYSCSSSFQTSDLKQSFTIFKNGELFLKNLKLDQLGSYQKSNIVTALQTIDILQQKGFHISQESLFSGMAKTISNTGLLGRWQYLNDKPIVICDTGHNEDGLRQNMHQLINMNYNNLHIILGVVNDKNITNILKLLPQNARYYFTKASIPRALDENLLQQEAQNYGLSGATYQTAIEAYDAAKAKAEEKDVIYIGGSTFIVADVL